MHGIAEAMDRNGYVLVPDILPSEDIAELRTVLATADLARAKRGGMTYGARNLLTLPEIRKAASANKLCASLESVLGRSFHAVRGIFFDKTEGANWPVLWHQDLSLALRKRRDLPGWTGWSDKRGIPHAQAPAEILDKMVTVRIHPDDCPSENGALRLIAGSHRRGRIPRETIRSVIANEPVDIVAAARGDALFMRPLILHASSPAQKPVHRRVLHLEFAPADLLPEELAWAEAI